MNFHVRFPLSLTLALATAIATHAQTAPATSPSPEKPIILPKIEVIATKPSLTAPPIAAARAELALTPGGTEVIDPERYLRGRASTVDDTFALSAGVVAQSRFGSDEARLSIRGSGIQRTFHGRGIMVLQDGVPLNLADGGFDMQALEPTATAYINLWRGANALAYGSSTLGGAIDYVSRNGRNSPGGFARVEYGSFDYLRATIADGGTHGDLDAYASFTEQKQDGFRDHAQQDNQRLFTNIGLRLSDNAETRLYITAVKTNSELPGYLTKAELNADPTQADNSFFGSVRYDNHRDFTLFRLAEKTTVITGDTTWNLTGAWTYKDLDHPITPFVGVIDQKSNNFYLGANATHTGDLLGHDNLLTGGVSLDRGNTDSATYANIFGRRGALTSNADQVAVNLAAFAENQFTLGRGFTLVTGATAAHNRRDNDQQIGAAASYDRDYHHVSPKLGLRWDGCDVQVYANLSASYEPPSFSETNSAVTANDAQTATTLELGTRGVRGPARWDASIYASRVKGEFLSLNDAFGTPLGTVNAGHTTHEGVELATEADLLGQSWHDQPANRLVARSAVTYGRFEFDDDPVYGDNTIAGIPPLIIHVELTWENTAGWYAGPTLQWVPEKTYVDEANTLYADPYALLGFKFGRRQTKGLSWFVEARNLTDKTYAATTDVMANAGGLDRRAFYPGDGRSLYAGLEYRW